MGHRVLALLAVGLLLLLDCPAAAVVLASQDFGSGTSCAADGVTTAGTVDCARTDWSVSGDSGWAEGTADSTEDVLQQSNFIASTPSTLYMSFCWRYSNAAVSALAKSFFAPTTSSGSEIDALRISLYTNTDPDTLYACNSDLATTSANPDTDYWIVQAYTPSTGSCQLWINGTSIGTRTITSGLAPVGYQARAGYTILNATFTSWFDNITFEDAFPSQNACQAGGGGGGPARRRMQLVDLREWLRAWVADSH